MSTEENETSHDGSTQQRQVDLKNLSPLDILMVLETIMTNPNNKYNYPTLTAFDAALAALKPILEEYETKYQTDIVITEIHEEGFGEEKVLGVGSKTH